MSSAQLIEGDASTKSGEFASAPARAPEGFVVRTFTYSCRGRLPLTGDALALTGVAG